MIKQNYGKYPIPKRLNELIDIQKRVNEQGLEKYGDMLGYYFSLEGIDTRYLNTPLDVIAFARPGVDGIHYGFLTEFGQVDDLHNSQAEDFFSHATYESKLAFLRDAQSKGLLFDNVAVKHFLKEQLRSMQLLDEAERISFP